MLGLVDNGTSVRDSGSIDQVLQHQAHVSGTRRGSNSSSGNNRRKTIINAGIAVAYHHQQQYQHLQLLHSVSNDDEHCRIDSASCASPARYSELFGSTVNSDLNTLHLSLSPIAHTPKQNHQQQQKLPSSTSEATKSFDRYEDTCCLPPPSPAPNNDRFIVGILGNCTEHCISDQHLQGQQTVRYISQTQSQSLSTSTSTSSLSTYSAGSSTNLTNTAHHVPAKYTSGSNSVVAVQRIISPSSRYQHIAGMNSCNGSINNRFRSDVLLPQPAPKTQNQILLDNSNGTFGNNTGNNTTGGNNSRYLSAIGGNAHFLAHSDTPTTTAVNCSTSSYTNYLSATVHTPVKRYVPTPPPTTDLYAELPLSLNMQQSSSSSMSAKKCTGSGTPQHHVNNTLSYRYRIKCCANDTAQQINTTQSQHQPQQLQLDQQNTHSLLDYYQTSPRMCSTYTLATGNITATTCNNKCNAVIAPQMIFNNSFINNNGNSKESPIVMLHEQQQHLTNVNCIVNNSDKNSDTSTVSSVASHLQDYMNSSESAGNINNNTNSIAATCLHCNTVRRTTGVHQTTQTTGPISPVPTSTSQHCSVASNNNIINNSFLQSHANVNETLIQQEQLTMVNENMTNAATTTIATTGPTIASTILTPTNNEHHVLPLTSTTATDVTNSQQQHSSRLLSKLDVTDQQNNGLTIAYNNQQHAAAQLQSQTQTNLYTTTQKTLPHYQTTIDNIPKNTGNNGRQLALTQQASQQIVPQQRFSRKKRFSEYLRKELANFFGVEAINELEECTLWHSRQRRLALRRFGALKSEHELQAELQNATTAITIACNLTEMNGNRTSCLPRSQQHSFSGQSNGMSNSVNNSVANNASFSHHQHHQNSATERPDILPAQDADAETAIVDENDNDSNILSKRQLQAQLKHVNNINDYQMSDPIERKASVASMIISSFSYIIQTINKLQSRTPRQWSRSFAPSHIYSNNGYESELLEQHQDVLEGLTTIQEEEVFFEVLGTDAVGNGNLVNAKISPTNLSTGNLIRGCGNNGPKLSLDQQQQQQIYMTERVHGWRTSGLLNGNSNAGSQQIQFQIHQQQTPQSNGSSSSSSSTSTNILGIGCRGNRISAQLLDGVLENSRRPYPVTQRRIELFALDSLDDRTDHRPFFTYWINTVQILILFLSLICYGIGPIGIGVEHKTGQVLVTSLSLQTVQHKEQRNVWIGPKNNDLVHMGAKFATCMRRDVKIIDVLLKTRRQERETACCIRNDDSGCVQSSQADCSVRGLFPTKSISTWKKWSPSESGPGGRISGSVCGLDPKYCDAPASIAPYEWPDDITKWPICRKTNSFSQRYRYKDHTAEHMVCEVIGHPCCTGVYGECRITTREYCDFVNGYFHEEASLCSQISCLNNVCGMIPFFNVEVPDQFYRLFTSLYLHAGILHLTITIAFQYVFLADLERLIGPIRTAILYIGSGLAGNLTSAVLVPYKPEVGPLASLSGVIASLVVLLILIHWKQLHKPHVALLKLVFIGALLFVMGTLPWQLNFAALLAGTFCGIFLTVALVPFVSINTYGRKSKINLIWSSILFHLFIYTIMFIIFYVFPTELTNLNFGEVLTNTFNTNIGINSVNSDSISEGKYISRDMISGNDLSSSSYYGEHSQHGQEQHLVNQQSQLLQQQQPLQEQLKFYYHHHRSSYDIISYTNITVSTKVYENT